MRQCQETLQQSLISATFMLKSNLYVIENGKLIPKQIPPHNLPNYQYIAYDPINRPMPDDYLKNRINELMQENKGLKSHVEELRGGSGLEQENQMLKADKMKLEIQVKGLREDNAALRLQPKYSSNSLKESCEAHCRQIDAQNKRIADLLGQIGRLKTKLNISESEALRINRVLDGYSETIERVSAAEKIITENTELSEILSRSLSRSRRAKKESLDSVEDRSNNSNADEYDERFMTPKGKGYQSLREESKNKTAIISGHLHGLMKINKINESGRQVESIEFQSSNQSSELSEVVARGTQVQMEEDWHMNTNGGQKPSFRASTIGGTARDDRWRSYKR